MKTPARDLEARRRLAAQPLFARVFPPGSVPTWAELADAAERLRLEGEGSLSAETMLAAARLEAPSRFSTCGLCGASWLEAEALPFHGRGRCTVESEEPPAHGRRK